MTEAESTPGPWHIMEGTDWVIVSPEVSVAAVYTPRGDREVRQANARLIAAAPDIEKALEILLDSHSGMSNRNCNCDECAPAKAALAKARGETDA